LQQAGALLLQYMNCNADVLKTLLQTAYERKLIEVKTVGKAKFYRLKIIDDSAIKQTVEALLLEAALSLGV
jgi:hypothetical protein